ncbi:hypothetical protein E2C01_076165 [Portunus trituberculatus]|uniref:Uncharacterized protein n=1 Tax=Portunus trituberculatus TaxID=210409 RepID=A0A5B7IGT4_PORTR|nr:hypothetical protein [Portunus trituberculatus]
MIDNRPLRPRPKKGALPASPRRIFPKGRADGISGQVTGQPISCMSSGQLPTFVQYDLKNISQTSTKPRTCFLAN